MAHLQVILQSQWHRELYLVGGCWGWLATISNACRHKLTAFLKSTLLAHPWPASVPPFSTGPQGHLSNARSPWPSSCLWFQSLASVLLVLTLGSLSEGAGRLHILYVDNNYFNGKSTRDLGTFRLWIFSPCRNTSNNGFLRSCKCWGVSTGWACLLV